MTQSRTCPRCAAPLAESGSASGLCPRCLLTLGLEDDQSWVVTRSGSGPPPTPEELSEAFPDLEIEELLGQGGMGAVYRARQKSLDRMVALKVLRADLARDPAFTERFQREARALGRLSHPGIVSVHDAGQSGEHLYLTMEFVDGANLRSVLRAGELSSNEVLALIGQLCDALQYAHDHGVVHRDIKPENILVDSRGQVKVADFGLAKLVRGEPGQVTLTEPAHAVGTAHYMAPEQVETPRDVDHRADIYALGVVFYEMLTGELPIGRFAAPSEKVQVDVRLDEVVLKTLAKERERRYQAADDVKTDVERISHKKGAGVKFVREGRGWKVGLGVLDDADIDLRGLLDGEFDLSGEDESDRRERDAERDGHGDGHGRHGHRSHAWKWVAGVLLALAFVPCCLGGVLVLFTGSRAQSEHAAAVQAEAVAAMNLAALELDAQAATRTDAVLVDKHRRYLRLEEKAVRELGASDGQSLELFIEEFAADRAKLISATLYELEAAVGDERWGDVRSEIDLADLFPFGAEGTRIAIRRDGLGWLVETRIGAATSSVRVGSLSDPYRRLWERFRGELR